MASKGLLRVVGARRAERRVCSGAHAGDAATSLGKQTSAHCLPATRARARNLASRDETRCTCAGNLSQLALALEGRRKANEEGARMRINGLRARCAYANKHTRTLARMHAFTQAAKHALARACPCARNASKGDERASSLTTPLWVQLLPQQGRTKPNS
eukprot:1357898-Pleurochrysis_carterae.AAC.2